jgi:uncharacterized protein YaaN involved in tellurite resistance
MGKKKKEETALALADPSQIQQELGLTDAKSIALEGEVDPALDKQADEFVALVLAFNPQDPAQVDSRDQNIAAVESLGSKVQREAAHRSVMLKEPIRKLAARGEDGGEVANALVDLNLHVEDLDPGKFDFEPGWKGRLVGMIPGVGKPLKRYFIKFESAQTVIDTIFRALDEGANVLKRDNVTLGQDQKVMRLLTFKLQKAIQLGMLIDQKLSYALERDIMPDDPRHRFTEEELLFPLRQRLQDVQQQLAVNQQGVLSIEIVVRNNKELIRGVNRAVNVTVNALNVAVTVAMALANQKIVLDKIEAVTRTTNRLIAQTARQLRERGVAIHKQASSTQLDMDVLRGAFADIKGAMDDISNFRREALPQMAKNILEMDKLTTAAEEAIQRMEQGTKAAPAVALEVE